LIRLHTWNGEGGFPPAPQRYRTGTKETNTADGRRNPPKVPPNAKMQNKHQSSAEKLSTEGLQGIDFRGRITKDFGAQTDELVDI
jgi:hypothetical protein